MSTALAELDRIWGNPAAEPAPPTADADGCVVVLDLARAGERLLPEAVGPTLQRVARRLTDRLPPRSRLRDDGPDTLSVVLPGSDRAVASEWMHRVLPGLVDGLAVDEAVSGALLRAAVHDADGVVGAQVLQRLDGAQRAERGRRTDRDAAAARWEPAGHVDPDPAAAGDPAGPGRREGADPAAGRRDQGSVLGRAVAGGLVDGETVGDGAVPAPARSAARHDESAGRPPYLPAGVVVRPGSGGRRHRRGPAESAAEPAAAPDPAPPSPAPPSPAPQSTEGLGLADLLAGALAAYRGI